MASLGLPSNSNSTLCHLERPRLSSESTKHHPNNLQDGVSFQKLVSVLALCPTAVSDANGSQSASTQNRPTLLTGTDSIVDAKNKVPQNQRFYQKAYAAHTRLWMIVRPPVPPTTPMPNRTDEIQGSRSRWYMVPYTFLLWGTLGGQ